MGRSAKPRTELARRLIEVRGSMKQDEFAQSLSLLPGTYSNYERSSKPKIDILLRIAHVHGVNLHWLLTGQGPQKTRECGHSSVSDLRQYVWAIAVTYWQTTPRPICPEKFAAGFLDLFDELFQDHNERDEAVSDLIAFAAELKTIRNKDKRKK